MFSPSPIWGCNAQSVLILPCGVALVLVPRIAVAIQLAHDLSSGKKMEKRLDCGTKESENVNFVGEGRSVFCDGLTTFDCEWRGSFLPRQ